jgi:enoyl-CoA hydratase/carnithine racemase
MNHLIFEKKDKIGWIILNRPKHRNALSIEMMNEMQILLNQISNNKEVNVVVIKGNGPAFCAGHDINELVGKNYDIQHFRNVFSTCSKMMQTIHKISQPVIAQVHGIATAAGCQLVATCDLAIADIKTKFSTPGVKIGLFCSTPMVPLSRIVGRRRALEMLLTGRLVTAEEAEKFGLINKVVKKEKLDEETEKWANEISKYSLNILDTGKKAFYKQIDMDEESAYEFAKETIASNCLAEDAQEGMKAYLDRRKPVWKNR